MMIIHDAIKEKINFKLSPEKISLIDNSYLHTKHKSFDIKKFNLKLIIKSKKLSEMNKIDAHKLIYSILKDEIALKIHALEIHIE
jgi:BolA protein